MFVTSGGLNRYRDAFNDACRRHNLGVATGLALTRGRMYVCDRPHDPRVMLGENEEGTDRPSSRYHLALADDALYVTGPPVSVSTP